MSTDYKLPRSTPEAQGVSSRVIKAWLMALDKLRFPHSFMLVRNGFVIAEGWWNPYAPEVRHQLYSLSKSFTSIAIGLAMEEGRLTLNDLVARFFPDKLPRDMADGFNRMTIRHLLTMSSGHSSCPFSKYMQKAQDGDFVREFFARPVEFEPGTHFVYNSAASYMLSAIISKVTGENLVAYLNPRLLLPLGIKNACWDSCPRGISLGAWGLYLTTEAIARFAQMLLDQGKWNGQQLISSEYMKTATSCQVDTSVMEKPDWKMGYGFQFWRCQHNAFRGDGAFGQSALVMPDLDMTLAVTNGVINGQPILTLVWDILLQGVEKNKLPEDPVALNDLRSLSTALRMPLAKNNSDSDVKSAVFEIKANAVGLKRIGVDILKKECAITFALANKTETLRAGFGENIMGEESIFYKTPRKVAASAAWQSPSHLEIACCYYETPFIVTFHCQFDGATLRFESSSNLQFQTTDWGLLEGVKI